MNKREKWLLIKKLPIAEKLNGHDIYIAGGAITSVFSNNEINDYDFYFSSVEELRYMFDVVLKDEEPVFSTETAKSYNIDDCKIQIICNNDFIGDIEKTIDRFDFTVCQGYYSFKDNEFHLKDDFLKHLSQKRLVFTNKTDYPLTSLIRALKYKNKGFEISGLEMMKIGLKVNQIKIETIADLKKQLMGIDTLFLKDFTDTLNNKLLDKYEFDEFIYLIDEFIEQNYNLNKIFDTEND